MKRNLVLAAAASGTLTLGLLAAPGHAPLRLLTAASSHEPAADVVTFGPPELEGSPPATTPPVHDGTDDAAGPSTTVAPEGPHGTTTSEPAARHDAPTTTAPHESTTTAPHEIRHEPTTSTTAPRPSTSGGPLTMACTTSRTDADPSVACVWKGVPDAAVELVVMRERPGTSSQPIWRTTDTTVRRYDDATAEAGVTYSYRVSAYGTGERSLGTSNPVRVTPGTDGGVSSTTQPQPPTVRIALICASTGAHAVHCSWEKGPAGTASYRLIRIVPDHDNRIVATTDAEHLAADDADVPTGAQTYYIQVVDGAGRTIAGGKAEISCCATAETSR